VVGISNDHWFVALTRQKYQIKRLAYWLDDGGPAASAREPIGLSSTA
jgi:hypothetical protein